MAAILAGLKTVGHTRMCREVWEVWRERGEGEEEGKWGGEEGRGRGEGKRGGEEGGEEGRGRGEEKRGWRKRGGSRRGEGEVDGRKRGGRGR